MEKRTIVVLFGGQSSEHDVSCMSAANIIDCIDPDKYEICLIGITKDGKWIYTESIDDIRSGEWTKGTIRAIISPQADIKTMYLIDGESVKQKRIDLAFPILHGLYGEDGTVQGIFELAGIPYVGCGVLASAVAMDKLYTKLVVDTLNIRQAKYQPVFKEQLKEIDQVIDRIEAALPYPVFVKPSCAGSSKGVSKAKNSEQLIRALHEAAKHDRKILVEEAIVGREIECAVLGGHEVRSTGVGEILSAAEFYDFEAKYFNAESKTVLDPELPEETVEEIRRDAVEIFKAIDGFGLSRVDFFVTHDTGEVVFNEINTIPGFTTISMYPMLWERKGIGKKALVEKMIELAYNRG